MQRLSLVFKNYLFWWVLFLSAFIPLYPKFPLVNVPGTYVAIRLEDFLIAIASIWWFVSIYPNLKHVLSDNLTKLFLVFWGIGALSLFSGIFLTSTVTPHLGLFHFLRRVETMMLFFIAYTAIKTEKQIRIWLLVMFITAILVILYGFGQQYLRFPVISTTNREFSKGLILFLSPEARVNSTFAGHYDLAAFLAFFLTCLAGFFFSVKMWSQRILFLIAGILGFVLLAMTAARVSFVAVLVGITSLLFMIGKKKFILVLILAAALSFVVSPDLRHRTIATVTVNFLGGGGAKYTPPPQMPGQTNKFSIENAATGEATPAGVPVDIAPGEPLNSTELGVYRSYGIRLDEEWPRAIRALEKNPFLGTGYSSITIATDNDFLRSLGEVGILGTLSMILIFYYLIKKMLRFIKIKNGFYFNLIASILAGLLTIFITQTFIDVFESSKVAQLLWITLGVGFAAMNIKKETNVG